MRTQETAKKRKIEKGKEEESQYKIQKESRTKENIKQKEEQYKQEKSQNKENIEMETKI